MTWHIAVGFEEVASYVAHEAFTFPSIIRRFVFQLKRGGEPSLAFVDRLAMAAL